MEDMRKIVKRFSAFNYSNYNNDYKEKRSKTLLTNLRKMSPEKIIKDDSVVKGTHPYLNFINVFTKLCKVSRGFFWVVFKLSIRAKELLLLN